MNRHTHAFQLSVAAIVLGTGSLFAAPASAVDKLRSHYQNTGGNCHAANPWDELSYMDRNPLGYRNSSNSNSITHNTPVVCNFLSDMFAVSNPVNTSRTVQAVYIYARAWRNRDVNLTCVATAGYAGSQTNVTLTKTIALEGDGLQKYLGFTTADNGGQNFRAPVNVVCSVPGGVELNDAAIFYSEDVGN